MTKKYINIHSIRHVLDTHLKGECDVDLTNLTLYKTTDNLLINLVLYTDVRKLVNNATHFKRLAYQCGYCNFINDYVEIQEKDFKLYKEDPYV